MTWSFPVLDLGADIDMVECVFMQRGIIFSKTLQTDSKLATLF